MVVHASPMDFEMWNKSTKIQDNIKPLGIFMCIVHISMCIVHISMCIETTKVKFSSYITKRKYQQQNHTYTDIRNIQIYRY